MKWITRPTVSNVVGHAKIPPINFDALTKELISRHFNGFTFEADFENSSSVECRGDFDGVLMLHPHGGITGMGFKKEEEFCKMCEKLKNIIEEL